MRRRSLGVTHPCAQTTKRLVCVVPLQVVPIAARRTPRQKRTRVRYYTYTSVAQLSSCSLGHHSQAVDADGLETWQHEPGVYNSQRSSQNAQLVTTNRQQPIQTNAQANFGKRRKLSSRVSRRMLVEENACKPEGDWLIERAKRPPYNF